MAQPCAKRIKTLQKAHKWRIKRVEKANAEVDAKQETLRTANDEYEAALEKQGQAEDELARILSDLEQAKNEREDEAVAKTENSAEKLFQTLNDALTKSVSGAEPGAVQSSLQQCMQVMVAIQNNLTKGGNTGMDTTGTTGVNAAPPTGTDEVPAPSTPAKQPSQKVKAGESVTPQGKVNATVQPQQQGIPLMQQGTFRDGAATSDAPVVGGRASTESVGESKAAVDTPVDASPSPSTDGSPAPASPFTRQEQRYAAEQYEAAKEAGQEIPVLPGGWGSHWDPKTSRTYYCNSVTSHVQWEVPLHPVGSFAHPAPVPAAVPAVEECAKDKANSRNEAFKQGCKAEAAKTVRAQTMKLFSTRQREATLTAKRGSATCTAENAAGVAAGSEETCFEIHSDGTISDDDLLLRTKANLAPTMKQEQVFRESTQVQSPSAACPEVVVV